MIVMIRFKTLLPLIRVDVDVRRWLIEILKECRAKRGLRRVSKPLEQVAQITRDILAPIITQASHENASDASTATPADVLGDVVKRT